MLERRGCQVRGGFTLLELTIVVLLVSILGVVVLPSGAGEDQARVDAAAQEVAAALRFARDESLRTGDVYGVYLQVGDERLRVFRADLAATPPGMLWDVYHPIDGKPWDVELDDQPGTEGVDLQRSMLWRASCNQNGKVLFRDAGTPVCRDPLSALLTTGTYTLSRGDASQDVVIDGMTGRVHLP